MVTPALAPTIAMRRGKEIVIPRSASIPARCLKCAAPAEKPWRKKFYWHNPWLFLLVIFPGLLIYAIVALIVRKQMELNIPLCDTHHAERRRYNLLAMLMLIGFIPLGIILGVYLSEPLGWITGIVMFFAGIVFYSMGQLGIRPMKIDEVGGVFRGACTEFLDLLPQQQ